MSWIDYTRGYEDGQYDCCANRRDSGRGLIASLLMLSINLVLIAVMLCLLVLKNLYRLFKAILYRRSGK